MPKWWPAAQFIIGFMVTVNTGALGYLANQISDLRTKTDGVIVDQATMSGNRFTSGDGLEIWKAISDLKQLMATFPKEAPPQWFVDRVAALEKRIDRNEAKLDEILNLTRERRQVN